MTSPPEDRPPLVVGYEWAARVTTVSLEMVLPGMAGYWIDQRLGTKAVFTILGFAVGLPLGIWHLIRMTSPRPDGDHLLGSHPPPHDDAQGTTRK